MIKCPVLAVCPVLMFVLGTWCRMRLTRGMPNRPTALLTGRGERPASDHESVTSVVARMVATAEDENGGMGAVSAIPATAYRPGVLQVHEGSLAATSPGLPGPPMVMQGRSWVPHWLQNLVVPHAYIH